MKNCLKKQQTQKKCLFWTEDARRWGCASIAGSAGVQADIFNLQEITTKL